MKLVLVTLAALIFSHPLLADGETPESRVKLGVNFGSSAPALSRTGNDGARDVDDRYSARTAFAVGITADVALVDKLALALDAAFGTESSARIDGAPGLVQRSNALLPNLEYSRDERLLGFRVTPKAGLGFGKVWNTLGSSAGSRELMVHGMFGVLGVQVESDDLPVLVDIDWAFSLVTSAGDRDGSFAGGGFNRLRVGALYRVRPHLLVGPQFIHRGSSFSSDVGASRLRMDIGFDQFLINARLELF